MSLVVLCLRSNQRNIANNRVVVVSGRAGNRKVTRLRCKQRGDEREREREREQLYTVAK